MSVVSPVGSFDSSSCCSLLRQFVFWHELSWCSRLSPPSDTVNVFCLFLTSSPAAPADIMCPILELHQVSHITLKILTCRWLEIYYSDRYCSRSAFSYVLWLCCRGLMWSVKEKNRLPLNKWVISVLGLALKIPLQCILIFWWYFRVLSFPIHAIVPANIGATGSPCLLY